MRIRRRFTYAERQHLEHLFKKGLTVSAAAIHLKRTRGSLQAETGKTGGAKHYSAKRAHLVACSLKMGLEIEDESLRFGFLEEPTAVAPAPAHEPDSTLEDKMAALAMQVEIAFDMIKELQNKLNKQEVLV